MAEESYISSACLGSPTTAYTEYSQICVALNTDDTDDTDDADDEYVNAADGYQTSSSPCGTGGTITVETNDDNSGASGIVIIIIVVVVVCGCFCCLLVICFCVGGPAALCLLVGISKRPYAPPGPNSGTIFSRNQI